MGPLFLPMIRSVSKLISFTILLLFGLACTSFTATEAYDPLDPNGNITIKWDIISWTPDGYVKHVSEFQGITRAAYQVLQALLLPSNFQKYRHIQAPGWSLGWTWAKNELYGTWWEDKPQSKGIVQNLKQQPHCCKKNPTVVDLLPGTPYNQQITNCCKGGVLTSWVQDPANAVGLFN
ncbi:COBRA-like protein 1 [Prunus yedoensis var. nudiflora]|uniref:COBRA-like protein 1 n=1 Tax=Prunus yedoensis var. nudiflora TaxID=2094558 RepID=A0A314XX30_PRUYE|nr:COBRA-like protein 1 [Prunus yedoensis var. nudiflora]